MQLDELRRGLSGLAGRFLNRVRGGDLLVVVLEEFSVRGVLIRKKGHQRLELERFMEVQFETSMANPKLKLAHLFKAWGGIPARRILIVTDEFTSTPAELPKPRPSRLAPYKAMDALTATARYEIGPFLEYPAAEAMIGVYLPPPPVDPMDEFGIDEPTTVQAMIFAIHGKTYQTLKRVCSNLKMTLVGLVPEEVFAFARGGDGDALQACLLDEADDTPRILVNWRTYDAVAALVLARVPVAFLHRNFEAGESEAEALMDMAREVALESPFTEEKDPLILLGGEGSEEDWRESVREAAPEASVRAWDMAVELPGLAAPGPVPGRYMTALSAAVHTSGKGNDPILVNDRVPLRVRAMSHPLFLPALAVLVCLAVLSADLGWWKYRVSGMRDAVAVLAERKKELEKAAKGETDVRQQFDSLKKQRLEILKTTALLETGLPERQLLLQSFLAGLIAETPETVQLENVRQFSEQVWFLEGVARRYDVVSRYVVRLKNLPMARQCRLENSNVRGGGEGEGVFHFSIRLRLEEG